MRCYNPRTRTDYGCGLLSGLAVNNNLWARVNQAYRAGIPYVFAFGNSGMNELFAHNTVDGTFPDSFRGFYEESQVFPDQNVVVRDNLMKTGMTTDGGTEYDFSAINFMMCNTVKPASEPPDDSVCPAGVFTHNLIPGMHLYSGSGPDGTCQTMDTRPFGKNLGYHNYPCDNWNDSWSSIQFTRPEALDYTLAPGSRFHGAATDGADVGVNTATLPLIQDLAVRPTLSGAVFSFNLTAPIQSIPCVIRVSPSPDFKTVVSDLDPSLYTQPDSSNSAGNVSNGASREMQVGRNAPLRPDSTYYYDLACGGSSAQGSFHTLQQRQQQF